MSPTASHASVTLLWGEDEFLLRERALELLEGLKPTEVDAAEWRGSELQDLATPSLFGEPRALMISDAKSLPKEALAELAAYVAAPDPDAPLVICAQVGDRVKVPAALDKMVKPVGQVVEVKIARKDLEPWLMQRAKRESWMSRRPRSTRSSRRSAKNRGSSWRRSDNWARRSPANASHRRSWPSSSAGSANSRSGISAIMRSRRTCPARSARGDRSRRVEATR